MRRACCAMCVLVATASPAHGQNKPSDSASVAAGISQYIVTIPRAGPGGRSPAPFVVDTTRGGWNALVGRKLRLVHTPLLLSLPDSQAYFALTLAVGRVDFRADTVVAFISWNTCRQDQLSARGYESGGEAKSILLVRAGAEWRPAFPANPGRLLLGHGWCPLYRPMSNSGHR